MRFPQSLHWRRPTALFSTGPRPIFYQQLLPMEAPREVQPPSLEQIVIALLQYEYWLVTHNLCAGTPAWWSAIDSGLIEGGYFDLLRTPL